MADSSKNVFQGRL